MKNFLIQILRENLKYKKTQFLKRIDRKMQNLLKAQQLKMFLERKELDAFFLPRLVFMYMYVSVHVCVFVLILFYKRICFLLHAAPLGLWNH